MASLLTCKGHDCMKVSHSLELIWLGLKGSSLERFKNVPAYMKAKGARHLKIGGYVFLGYLAMVMTYLGTTFWAYPERFFNEKEFTIYTAPSIDAILDFQALDANHKKPDERLKELASRIKPQKWGEAYVADNTDTYAINGLKSHARLMMTYAFIQHSEQQMEQQALSDLQSPDVSIVQASLKGPAHQRLQKTIPIVDSLEEWNAARKIELEARLDEKTLQKLLDLREKIKTEESLKKDEFKLDFSLLHGAELLTSRTFMGGGDRLKRIQMQYQALPPNIQKSYDSYMKHRVLTTLKTGFISGWMSSCWVCISVMSVLLFAALLIYFVAVIVIFKGGKAKLESLKEKGEELYGEKVAKKEQEMLDEETVHHVKGNAPSRPKSL